MANLRGIATKLQTALCQKGVYIKINQMQAYSESYERMVTKYIMVLIDKKTGKNTTILETYKLIDVVQRLADMYGGG